LFLVKPQPTAGDDCEQRQEQNGSRIHFFDGASKPLL